MSSSSATPSRTPSKGKGSTPNNKSTASTPTSSSAAAVPPVPTRAPEVGDHSVMSRHLSSSVLSSHIKVKAMWEEIMREINSNDDAIDYTTQDIPLQLTNRILTEEALHLLGKQISVMDCNDKSASIALSKLCEFFVLELTLKAYELRKDKNGSSLTRADILEAIEKNEVYDLFLEQLDP